MRRRTCLALLAGSALGIGVLGAAGPGSEQTRPGPQRSGRREHLPDADGEWELAFEDRFETPTLDSSDWTIGWGWGTETSTSPTSIVPENVTVTDGALRLAGTHDAEGIKAGAVNTRDKVVFGPGSYLEASIRFARRTGFQNAFWTKPNDERWPPEIDVTEFWQENDGADPSTSYHFLHYSESTVPGDGTSYRSRRRTHEADTDLSESFHVYGVEWQPDRIVHYVDGEPVARCPEPVILTAMGTGAPFYMMLSMNIDNIGTADRSVSWSEEMVVEWVRQWDFVPDTVDDADEHYLWLRTESAGELAAFTFRTSGGDVRLDSSENQSGYWVTEDGTGGGGSVHRRDSLPGFRFSGEITAFRYDGPLEVYLDNSQVDPSSLAGSE